jgi:hypothetical protein
MDRDFAPLFNFLSQPPRVFDGTAPVEPLTAPPTPRVAPPKAPAAAAASGLLRRLRSAAGSVRSARRRVAQVAVARPEAKPDRVRVWVDLDELACNVVRADGRSPDAADAADWLLRLNFSYDGEAWCGDRDDLRLVGNVGVRKVRRGE